MNKKECYEEKIISLLSLVIIGLPMVAGEEARLERAIGRGGKHYVSPRVHHPMAYETQARRGGYGASGEVIKKEQYPGMEKESEQMKAEEARVARGPMYHRDVRGVGHHPMAYETPQRPARYVPGGVVSEPVDTGFLGSAEEREIARLKSHGLPVPVKH